QPPFSLLRQKPREPGRSSRALSRLSSLSRIIAGRRPATMALVFECLRIEIAGNAQSGSIYSLTWSSDSIAAAAATSSEPGDGLNNRRVLGHSVRIGSAPDWPL